MTNVKLVKDENHHSVQALAPDNVIVISTSASSARDVLANNTQVVMISVTEATWVAFGDGTVVAVVGTNAVSFLIPGGGVTLKVPDGVTHVAGIRETTSGKLCVTKLV